MTKSALWNSGIAGIVLAITTQSSIPASAQTPVPVTPAHSPVLSTTSYAGVSPAAMAINISTGAVYVANQGDDILTIINGTTNVISSIRVGSKPNAVAVNPATNTAYIVNGGENAVCVVDEATLNITAWIATGPNPVAIAVNPRTNMVYVVNNGGNSVTVIDGATNTVAATVPVGISPNALALDGAGYIYVTNGGSNSLSVISGGTVSRTFAVGQNPVAVAVNLNPLAPYIYVVNHGNGSTNGTVTVIAPAGQQTVTVGPAPNGLAVDPIVNNIYVSYGGASASSITVINETTFVPVSVPVYVNPVLLAVNPTTNLVYVADSVFGIVTVIDGSNPQYPVVATFTALGPPSLYANGTTFSPVAITVNPLTGKTYVASNNNKYTPSSPHVGIVSLFLEAPYALTSSLTLGNNSAPVPADIDTGEHNVYVANSYDNTVSIINEASLQTSTVPVGKTPVAVAANSTASQIYVANQTDGTVSVLDGIFIGTVSTVSVVGMIPTTLAINPQTNKTYVAGYDRTTFTASPITVIDGATQTTTSINVTSGTTMTVNPQTNMLYVGTTGGGVTVFNAATNTVTATIPLNVPGYAIAIAVNPATNKIYVGSTASTVSVIDGNTNTVQATVTLGLYPTQVAVNPHTNLVYLSGGNMVTVLDGDYNYVADTFTFQGPCALAVDTQRNLVYVGAGGTNASLAALGIMDGGKNTTGVLGVAPGPLVTGNPGGTLLFDPDTAAIYFLQPQTNSVVSRTVVTVYQESGQLAITGPIQPNARSRRQPRI